MIFVHSITLIMVLLFLLLDNRIFFFGVGPSAQNL